MEEAKVSKVEKKTVLNRVMNIVATVLIVIVLILGLSALTSLGKGYSSVFGTAYISVLSDSMDGDLKKGQVFTGTEDIVNASGAIDEDQAVSPKLKVGGFKKGDQIHVKIIEGTAKAKNLHVGDVITFWTRDILESGEKVLNSHRIIAVTKGMYGDELRVTYTTKGDNSSGTEIVGSSEVIGYYKGIAIPVLGSINTFLASSNGFLIFIVIPSFFILLFVIYKLIMMVRAVNKESFENSKKDLKEKILEEEKERLKAELLKEMQDEGAIPVEAGAEVANDSQNAETLKNNSNEENGKKLEDVTPTLVDAGDEKVEAIADNNTAEVVEKPKKTTATSKAKKTTGAKKTTAKAKSSTSSKKGVASSKPKTTASKAKSKSVK